MVWSTPKTYTAGAVLTAAELNQYQRDNFNETSAATVTTAGDLVFADAANSMGARLGIDPFGGNGGFLVTTGSVPVWREVIHTPGSFSATSSSNTYITLDNWTGGSAVQVSVLTGTDALVFMTARCSNDTAGESVFLTFEVSGATTVASADSRAGRYESSNADDVANPAVMEGVTLNAGGNLFKASARVSAGTGTIAKVDLIVIPHS